MIVPFSVNSPKIEKREINRGEDAPVVNTDGIMIICDGTGATGQEEHSVDGEIYTSAYLGSRVTSETAELFLTENYERITEAFGDCENMLGIIGELGKTIQDKLSEYVINKALTLTVRGKSFKLLPTTFTAVIYRICEMHIEVTVIFAGDSQALWWDSEGLHLLSSEGDSSIVAGDCNISNCISADSDFSLSFSCHKLSANGVLFATSDGFTDPILPFDQERYLIEWIGNFDGINEQNSDLLSEKISGELDRLGFTKRDDCSIAGIIIGYSDDDELKDEFRTRYKDGLVEKYVKPYRILNKQLNELETEIYEIEIALNETGERLDETDDCSEEKLNEENKYDELKKQLEALYSERNEISDNYNEQYKKYIFSPLIHGTVLFEKVGEEPNGED